MCGTTLVFPCAVSADGFPPAVDNEWRRELRKTVGKYVYNNVCRFGPSGNEKYQFLENANQEVLKELYDRAQFDVSTIKRVVSKNCEQLRYKRKYYPQTEYTEETVADRYSDSDPVANASRRENVQKVAKTVEQVRARSTPREIRLLDLPDADGLSKPCRELAEKIGTKKSAANETRNHIIEALRPEFEPVWIEHLDLGGEQRRKLDSERSRARSKRDSDDDFDD